MTDMQRDKMGGTNGGAELVSAVGSLLRQARERSGQSLATAAQQLRIRETYLNAIEQGDFRQLPGPTYAVGFVRSYADHLGLDPQEIVRRFREEVDELGRRTALVFPSGSAEAKLPGGLILLIAGMVALVGYGGWYYLSERDSSIAELVPAVPLEMQQTAEQEATAPDAAPSPPSDAGPTLAPSASATDGGTVVEPPSPDGTEDAASEAAVPPAAGIGDGDAAEQPAAGSDVAAESTAATAPSLAAEAAADAPAPSSELIPQAPTPPNGTENLPVGQQYGVTNTDARVVLVAVQESWVQVKTSTGEEVWTKVLREGDRFMVPNEAGLLLATGNAGGLQIMVDGHAIPRLGPIGVVRRGISLDPERLLDGSAIP